MKIVLTTLHWTKVALLQHTKSRPHVQGSLPMSSKKFSSYIDTDSP